MWEENRVKSQQPSTTKLICIYLFLEVLPQSFEDEILQLLNAFWKNLLIHELVNFSKRHLATEESHLQKIEAVLPKKDRCKLVWLWKVAGFLLGFLPTLFGPKIVFATIEAVEAFVEEHYEEQLKYLRAQSNPNHDWDLTELEDI